LIVKDRFTIVKVCVWFKCYDCRMVVGERWVHECDFIEMSYNCACTHVNQYDNLYWLLKIGLWLLKIGLWLLKIGLLLLKIGLLLLKIGLCALNAMIGEWLLVKGECMSVILLHMDQNYCNFSNYWLQINAQPFVLLWHYMNWFVFLYYYFSIVK
jgi:hypothetical protein